VSCDAPLSGPYCSQCGERTIEPKALTLRHFLVHTVAAMLLYVLNTAFMTGVQVAGAAIALALV
jgi:hypothetical protein